MILVAKKNDLIKKGVLEYHINPSSGIVNCDLKYTYYDNLDNEVNSNFTLIPTSIRDVLSFHYRVVGEVKQFGKYSLTVKSKDCASVKCNFTTQDNSAIGEILFDTHNIFLTIWRLDITVCISGEKTRIRWVYGQE